MRRRLGWEALVEGRPRNPLGIALVEPLRYGPPAARVEAALRVIEGDVDDLVVRERSFAPYALAKLGGYFTSDEISPKRTSMLG